MLGISIGAVTPQRSYGVSEAALLASLGAVNMGGLYVPRDTTSLFQSRTGGDQADTADDVVGLVLDKSQMGGETAADFISAQTDLATNGGFDTDSDWTKATGVTIASGTANFASVSDSFALRQNMGLSTGVRYHVTFTVSGWSAGEVYVKVNGGGTYAQSPAASVDGDYAFILTSTAADGILAFGCSGGFTGSIDNVEARAIPGNHAVAPSDSARPLLKDGSGDYKFLRFDGVDDRLNFEDGGVIDASLIAVAINTVEMSAYHTIYTMNQQVLYGNIQTSNVWGTYNGVNVPSSVDIRGDDSVVMINTRDYDDVDLYTNGSAPENVTTGTSFNGRTPGIGFSAGQSRQFDFYGGLHRQGDVTAAQAAAARAYLNSLIGAY